MIDKLRQDSFWMGLLLGLLIPAILFGLLELILFFLPQEIKMANVFTVQRLILISIIPNVLLLRYYLLKLKYDLTGRGILAVTFIIGIAFAILHYLPNS
jgi:RsiW-degrading membrane proteinase PrsW (M82 family)